MTERASAFIFDNPDSAHLLAKFFSTTEGNVRQPFNLSHVNFAHCPLHVSRLELPKGGFMLSGVFIAQAYGPVHLFAHTISFRRMNDGTFRATLNTFTRPASLSTHRNMLCFFSVIDAYERLKLVQRGTFDEHRIANGRGFERRRLEREGEDKDANAATVYPALCFKAAKLLPPEWQSALFPGDVQYARLEHQAVA